MYKQDEQLFKLLFYPYDVFMFQKFENDFYLTNKIFLVYSKPLLLLV